MSDKHVDYHEGAIADVRSAVTWYQERSPKAAVDFVEELHRATDNDPKSARALANREK